MDSVAEKGFVIELARFIAKDIPQKVLETKSYKSWTEAVYASLSLAAKQNGWVIHPKERLFVGEYLCDFTLHEVGYGCRVACESQWQHYGPDAHQGELDWAFDKLRGVKSDVKLFIFEGTQEQWSKVIASYLENYDQLSTREAYVALHWQRNRFLLSWWQPKHDGKQTLPIVFEFIPDLQIPNDWILDTYGNNAAVQCSACLKAFVVSALLNKQNGRSCPHCSGSVAIVEPSGYSVVPAAK